MICINSINANLILSLLSLDTGLIHAPIVIFGCANSSMSMSEILKADCPFKYKLLPLIESLDNNPPYLNNNSHSNNISDTITENKDCIEVKSSYYTFHIVVYILDLYYQNQCN